MNKKFARINIMFSMMLAFALLGLQNQPAALAQSPEFADQNLKALQLACLDQGRGVMARADALTGYTQFVSTRAGEPLRVDIALKGGAHADIAHAYLMECGVLFGLDDSENELRVVKEKTTSDGQRTTVLFQQEYNGIPVVAGEMFVQFDSNKDILAVGGEVLPKLHVDTAPTVDAVAARELAVESVAKGYGIAPVDFTTTEPVLKIYNPALLEPWAGATSLAWEMEVSLNAALHIRQYVLVNAHRGNVLVSFNKVDTALNRIVYNGTSSYPGTVVCTEGDPGDNNCDALDDTDDHDYAEAYIYSGSTYNYFFNNHGRDSYDDLGSSLGVVTKYPGSCNAFWDGTRVVVTSGCAHNGTDDTMAHEWTHAITEHEAGLFYYYQSGAINESMSDVFGEFVDFVTANAKYNDDSAGARWLLFEDADPGGINQGPYRDMQDPTVFGDPDRMSSPNYYTDAGDNGGVHTNSGVGNKAAYLMTDGDTFNGITVTGLGVPKVSAIFYETLTNLMVSGSDYRDLHDALYQACQNLVGITPAGAGSAISTADCNDGVLAALEAVEMDEEPYLGYNPEAPVCDSGEPLNILYDDIETANYNWNYDGVNNTANPTDYPHWSRAVFYSTSGVASIYGDDYDYDGGLDTSDTYVAMRSRVYVHPSLTNAYLRFNHAFGFEDSGGFNYDGGVLEYSLNNGASWADAGGLIDNPIYGYNGSITTVSDNPIEGRSAFVGDSHGFRSVRLNLTGFRGFSLLFRWRMGTDMSVYDWGWWVDDVQIYSCMPAVTTVLSQSFKSQGANDGWILESGETSNIGGTMSATGTMRVGDETGNRQYRSIISFDTSLLPDNAVVLTAVIVTRQYGNYVGQNPFNTHGMLVADARMNRFGTLVPLELGDFKAGANLMSVAPFNPSALGGWRAANVSASIPFIRGYGITQYRLRFITDDNNDNGADYIRIYQGETGSGPQLILTYFVP